jgi:hypothetical protein
VAPQEQASVDISPRARAWTRLHLWVQPRTDSGQQALPAPGRTADRAAPAGPPATVRVTITGAVPQFDRLFSRARS